MTDHNAVHKINSGANDDGANPPDAALNPESLAIKPIGLVRNDIDEPRYIEWGNVISRIVISPEYRDGLYQLEEYSHLVVMFWLDQACYAKMRHVPQGKYDDVPEVGIFACRCPYRPNPVAVTTVPLLDVQGDVLTVKGLDAVDNTPIIDIKPYTPQYDFVCSGNAELRSMVCQNVRLPEWVFRLTY